jgi:hypothetical protein
MPGLGSWRKRCLISHEKVQNAQKGQKNGAAGQNALVGGLENF